MDLHGRSLLKEADLNADEFLFLVDLARRLRADQRQGVTGWPRSAHRYESRLAG